MSKIIAIEVRPVRFGDPALGEDDVITATGGDIEAWSVYSLAKTGFGGNAYNWMRDFKSEADARAFATNMSIQYGVPARNYTGI